MRSGPPSTACSKRKERFVIVHDMRLGKNPGVKEINLFADMTKANVKKDKLWAAGFAFVIGSAVLRAGLKGFFALSKLSAPTFVTDSLEEAESWAAQQLATAAAG